MNEGWSEDYLSGARLCVLVLSRPEGIHGLHQHRHNLRSDGEHV